MPIDRKRNMRRVFSEGQLSDATEDGPVDFFKGNPCLYGKGDPDYKNRPKRTGFSPMWLSGSMMKD